MSSRVYLPSTRALTIWRMRERGLSRAKPHFTSACDIEVSQKFEELVNRFDSYRFWIEFCDDPTWFWPADPALKK